MPNTDPRDEESFNSEEGGYLKYHFNYLILRILK